MALDPYYRWMGIPADEQPPNHYRLLAITPFEDSQEVIDAAADRQMGHLRNYQSGEHAELCQKLLNEVAAARVCLLAPEKKAAYDRELRELTKAQRKALPKARPVEAEATQTSAQSELDSGLAGLFDKTLNKPRVAAARVSNQRRHTQMAASAAIVFVGLVALVVVVFWARSGPGQTLLVLDWPAAERAQCRLEIDGQRVDLFTDGPLVYALSPGKHRVLATRPGYHDYTKEFSLARGQELTLSLVWVERPSFPEVKAAKPAPVVVRETRRRPPESPAAPAAFETSIAAPEARGDQTEPAPKPPPSKVAVPPKADRERIAEELRTIYELSKDRTPDQNMKLSAELANLAAESAAPAERYVLLEKAAELAGRGGDAVRMLRVTDGLAEQFEVDVLGEKQSMLEAFADSADDSAEIAALLAASDRVIDAALSLERYELAEALADKAYVACARPAGADHRKRAFERRREVQALAASWREMRSVFDRLKKDPDDPADNLKAGKHLCFEKGEWDRGLAHLAKSSDAALRKAARQETQSPPADPEAMIALGDAWWLLASGRDPAEREASLLRAGTWYREAQPLIGSTLLAAKIESRLQAIAELRRPVPRPATRKLREDCPELTRGLALYMPLDHDTVMAREGKVQALDLSGHGRHGLGEGPTPLPDGKVGGCLVLRASGLRVADTLFNRRPEYTVVLWYRDVIPHSYPISDFSTGGVIYEIVLSSRVDIAAWHVDLKPDHWLRTNFAQGAVQQDSWNFFSVRMEGAALREGNMTATINDRSFSAPLQAVHHPDESHALIGRGRGQTLDEVMVFHRALSDVEIQRLRRMGLNGNGLRKVTPDPPADESPSAKSAYDKLNSGSIDESTGGVRSQLRRAK